MVGVFPDPLFRACPDAVEGGARAMLANNKKRALGKGLTCTMEPRLYWSELAKGGGQTVAAGEAAHSGAGMQRRRENQP
jgi:hypothetical protein